MFVDASALVSIILVEEDAAIFASQLDRSEVKCVTPFVVMEAGLASMRELSRDVDATHAIILRILRQFNINTVELTPSMILTALKAFERYGKGRGHPARLNMGDCLSYAAARELGLPLLYKGDDFARTDIVSALAR